MDFDPMQKNKKTIKFNLNILNPNFGMMMFGKDFGSFIRLFKKEEKNNMGKYVCIEAK